MKHPLITRGQAACIFYGEAINPANELICEARIDSIPGVEICYIDNDPSEPFLVAEKRILFSPFRYQCYPPEISTAAHAADPTDLANAPSSLIHSSLQLAEFIDHVLLVDDPRNESVYERTYLSVTDIHEMISKHTSLFKSQGPRFTQFASQHKLNYLKAGSSRVRQDDNTRPWVKDLFVMKEHHRVFLAKNFNDYQARYLTFIKGLKDDGFKVVGYARKSPQEGDNPNLETNLNDMIACLRRRSMVDMVYVSPRSKANSTIASRDDPQIIDIEKLQLDDCAGDTQAMLAWLPSQEKVCLVVVDYAALSTVPVDVKDFIQNHECIHYIVVDRTSTNGKYEVIRRVPALSTKGYLDNFDCRQGFPKRSV